MESITIREATISDVSALTKISIETFSETYGNRNTKENMDLFLSSCFTEEKVRGEFDQPNAIFLTVFANEHLAGYAKLSSKYQPLKFADKRAYEIERIYVYARYQGKSLGKALLRECIERARAAGFDVIWLGVWEHNLKAIEFYQRQGFELFGEHDFKLGNDLQRDYLMKMDL